MNRFDDWKDVEDCSHCQLWESKQCDGKNGTCREFVRVQTRTREWMREFRRLWLAGGMLSMLVLIVIVWFATMSM